jgi:hypothetical protein
VSAPPPTRIDAALRALGELEAPPPSAELSALVAEMKPVEPRRPFRSFGLVVVACLAIVAFHVHTYDLRHDFEAIPKWWFWTLGGAWLCAYLVPLAVALVPAPGSIFVDARVARAAAFGVPVLAVTMAVLLRIDAPPATVIPSTTADTLGYIEWCLLNGLEMSVVPFVLGALVIRSAPQPLSTKWIGAALGAANGALTGLMLHFHCWIGGALHTGVAHAGHAVLGAIAGAIVVPALTHRRAPP